VRMSLWKETTLGEVCDEVNGIIQTGPFGSQLHQSDYSEVGIPVVMPKDIVEGRIAADSVARVSAEHVERLSRHKLSAGDIVYGRRGDIGRQALIRPEQAGWICGTGCLRLSLGNDVLDPLYLHYYLKQDDVVSWITNQAVGATMPNLNTGILRSVPVRFPPLPIQRRIAGILSVYDELIENSQRRIKILEAMARALYREWFVHFRFPGHESVPRVPSPLGDIPLGWEIEKLGRISKIVLGGTPSRSVNAYWEGGTIPWLKSGKLNDIRVIEGTEYITQFGLEKSATKLMPPKSVLVAITGAILVSFLEIEACANQSVIGMHGFERVCPEYVHLNLSENISSLESKMSGSAQQHINKEIVNETDILIPPKPIADAFTAVIQPVYEEIKVALFKSTNLRRTRDLLLPRLLSGQIDVEALA
jgi:type I restriction enzyme S subunit